MPRVLQAHPCTQTHGMTLRARTVSPSGDEHVDVVAGLEAPMLCAPITGSCGAEGTAGHLVGSVPDQSASSLVMQLGGREDDAKQRPPVSLAACTDVRP